MSISSIGSHLPTAQFQAQVSAVKTSEAAEVGPDQDGDSDDGGARAASANNTPRPNLLGQVIGQLLHTTA